MESLSCETFASEIKDNSVSSLGLLERYPTAQVPISVFLNMLPQLCLSQCSISSSPLANLGNCTLTWGFLDEESFPGAGNRHIGVASNYSFNPKGDHIHARVTQSHKSFHLPLAISNMSLIMICVT